MIVLSHIQIAPLLKARSTGKDRFTLSLDLNLSRSEVILEPEGVVFPDGQRLAWEALETIASQTTACFMVRENTLDRVYFFSEAFHRAYSLLPTENAPTMLLAGFPMHRIKGIDPQEDTRRKIRTIAPVSGRVLDT